MLEKLFHLQRCVLDRPCHGRERSGFEEVVESNRSGTAMFKGDELLIVKRKEPDVLIAPLFDRGSADEDNPCNVWKNIYHPRFIVVEYKFSDPILLNECLKGEGVKGVEDEVGIFEVNVESVFVPVFEIVQYQCGFAASPCTMEVDIAIFWQDSLTYNIVVILGRMGVIMFKQIHTNTYKFPFYKEIIFNIVPFGG